MPPPPTPPPTACSRGHEVEHLALRHALELDEVVARAVGRHQRAGVLEVLALGLALARLLDGLAVPVREQDAPVGGREAVALPLLDVGFIIEPLITAIFPANFLKRFFFGDLYLYFCLSRSIHLAQIAAGGLVHAPSMTMGTMGHQPHTWWPPS